MYDQRSVLPFVATLLLLILIPSSTYASKDATKNIDSKDAPKTFGDDGFQSVVELFEIFDPYKDLRNVNTCIEYPEPECAGAEEFNDKYYCCYSGCFEQVCACYNDTTLPKDLTEFSEFAKEQYFRFLPPADRVSALLIPYYYGICGTNKEGIDYDTLLRGNGEMRTLLNQRYEDMRWNNPHCTLCCIIRWSFKNVFLDDATGLKE
jgi:hypothetical protein